MIYGECWPSSGPSATSPASTAIWDGVNVRCYGRNERMTDKDTVTVEIPRSLAEPIRAGLDEGETLDEWVRSSLLVHLHQPDVGARGRGASVRTDVGDASDIIAVPAPDLAEGIEVAAGGKTRCISTGAVLREGDAAIVRLFKSPRTHRWSFGDVYHPAAAPVDDPVSTEVDGVTLYVKGRLAVCSDAATQEATLRLIDTETVSVLRTGDA